MRFGKPDRPGEATFDLTPMIDVVLLLIIFFMFTTQFARSEQSEMDLPGELGENKAPAPERAVFIDMEKDGTLKVMGRVVTLDSLAGVVIPESRNSGGTVEGLDLIVRADRAAPAVHLNRLAEALSRLGVRNWKLATSPDNARSGRGGAR